MHIDDFNRTIDLWIEALDCYTFEQLRTKPSASDWSIGQLYLHLINDTTYFLEEIRVCLSSSDNVTGEASAMAKVMFRNNDFPDERLLGSPDNSRISQPASSYQLRNSLLNLRTEFNEAARLITGSGSKGKTRHPGFNYFNANEWFQFAEMHLRHHFRQKKRIDDFLRPDQP